MPFAIENELRSYIIPFIARSIMEKTAFKYLYCGMPASRNCEAVYCALLFIINCHVRSFVH